MQLRFGKHKGQELSEIPETYLRWLYSVSRTLITEIEYELNIEPPTNGNHHTQPNLPPLTRDLVEAGYRALCKKVHPDTNGGKGHEKMLELNESIEQLRRILK